MITLCALAGFPFQQHGDGRCLDPALFADLWKIADASLTRTNADTDFCSANGKRTLNLLQREAA